MISTGEFPLAYVAEVPGAIFHHVPIDHTGEPSVGYDRAEPLVFCLLVGHEAT